MVDEVNIDKPLIYEYGDYRKFLKDFYHWKKSIRSSFSFRLFSKLAGFRSPNFLKLVMDGQRNLTLTSMLQVAKAIKFNKEETKFFQNLVLFNQCKSMEEKQQYAKELMRSRVYRKLKPLAKIQYKFWAKWYNVPIRELMGLKKDNMSPEWIANKLVPKIGLEEVSQSLQEMQELGLLETDPEGNLRTTEQNITTGDEVVSISVAQFHFEMIQKAREAIERFPSQKRQISATTMALSEENAEKIKAMIHQFRKDLIAISDEDQIADAIYQINFQIFPLTQKLEDDHEHEN